MDISELKDVLLRGGHSLAVYDGEVHLYDGRGVKDLHRLLTTEPQRLRQALLADKVVGKGAAALMILGQVKAVYADMVSTAALLLLRENDIQVSYGREVGHILNRSQDEICPVEQLCDDCRTAEECLSKITDFLQRMKSRKDINSNKL